MDLNLNNLLLFIPLIAGLILAYHLIFKVQLPGQGRMLRFSRSLQVTTNEPMSLQLRLERERPSGWFFGGIVAILSAGVLVVGWSLSRKVK